MKRGDVVKLTKKKIDHIYFEATYGYYPFLWGNNEKEIIEAQKRYIKEELKYLNYLKNEAYGVIEDGVEAFKIRWLNKWEGEFIKDNGLYGAWWKPEELILVKEVDADAPYKEFIKNGE